MDETLAVAADRNSTGDTAALSGLKFSKGHGTGNDFVLLADPNGTLAVTPGAGRGHSATGTAASAATG